MAVAPFSRPPGMIATPGSRHGATCTIAVAGWTDSSPNVHPAVSAKCSWSVHPQCPGGTLSIISLPSMPRHVTEAPKPSRGGGGSRLRGDRFGRASQKAPLPVATFEPVVARPLAMGCRASPRGLKVRNAGCFAAPAEGRAWTRPAAAPRLRAAQSQSRSLSTAPSSLAVWPWCGAVQVANLCVLSTWTQGAGDPSPNSISHATRQGSSELSACLVRAPAPGAWLRGREARGGHSAGARGRAATDMSVAVVLPGGGARGAYEVGALSALLPALEARGERVSIWCGTSVGAINAAVLASLAHLPAEEQVRAGSGDVGRAAKARRHREDGGSRAARAWRCASLAMRSGCRAWVSPACSTRLRWLAVSIAGSTGGVSRATLGRRDVDAICVVATRLATGTSVGFVATSRATPDRAGNEIRYVKTRLRRRARSRVRSDPGALPHCRGNRSASGRRPLHRWRHAAQQPNQARRRPWRREGDRDRLRAVQTCRRGVRRPLAGNRASPMWPSTSSTVCSSIRLGMICGALPLSTRSSSRIKASDRSGRRGPTGSHVGSRLTGGFPTRWSPPSEREKSDVWPR